MDKKQKRKIFFKMLKIVKESSQKYILWILFFTLVNPIISSIITWNEKRLLDFFSFKKFDSIVFLLICLLILELLLGISSKVKEWISYLLNYKIEEEINKKILEKMKNLDLELLEEPDYYNLLERMKNNISSNIMQVLGNLIEIIGLTVNCIVYSFLLYKIKWYFPIIFITFSIPYFLLFMKQGFDNYLLEIEQSKDTRRLAYFYDMLTNRKFAKEIRIFHLIDLLIKRADKIRKQLWKKEYHLLWKYSVWTIFIHLLRNIALCFCLFLTCIGVLNNTLTIGDIMLVITAINILTGDIGELVDILANIKKDTLYFTDFESYLNLTEEKKDSQTSVCEKEIIFQNVSFSYPHTKQYALKDINLEIKPNQIVALVGENGSGKTTFFNLLLGLYQPLEGEIFIGGKKLSAVIEDFRKKSTFLFQNFLCYQMTVKENLEAGNNNTEDTLQEDILNSEFGNFIKNLPKQFDTPLGQLDENGKELSGGEWQKLAICRALMRKNAEFLFLDEPTAALDPKIESSLYEQLKKLAKGKTTIIISHRLGITQICDFIYVFEKGKIIEQGNHEQLIKQKGKYFEMYYAQKSLYSE